MEMDHTVSGYMDIYHFVSNKANKAGSGQLHIFDSAEATTELSEDQSNQGDMAEIMQ
jgi:hypothetical protein